MKHLKHLFTAMLLLCCSITNAQRIEVGGIYYNVTNAISKTVEVTYRGTSYYEFSGEYAGDVVIPSFVTYNGIAYRVTSIGEYAFYDCPGLKSITISNSVTSIGDGAFAVCSGLTSIEIPNSVTSIGSSVFGYCGSLAEIIVKEGNSVYDSRNACNAIIETKTNTLVAGCKKTIIPNNITSIGNFAFDGCSGLESITIPNSVTSIGGSAFSGCTSLESIIIPNSITSIREQAFGGCTGLTYITIPDGVTSIGDWAFSGCLGLTSMAIGNGVTNIGDYAFYGCTGLEEIYVKAKTPPTTEINTFYDVPTTSATLYVPIGAKSAYQAADGWKDFANIVESDFNSFKADGIFYNITDAVNKTVEVTYRGTSYDEYSNEYTGNVVIPSSVTYYGEVYNVVSIKNFAFYNCSGLTNITIPNSVTSIGERAFDSCSGLTSVAIGNSVTNIGNYTFSYCTGLTNITIPNKVTTIGAGVFFGCTGLANIEIPNSVTSIGYRAFRDCRGLTSVTIPNSVTSIEGSAFNGCPGLTNITIPNSVTSIGDYAFYNCSGLTSITIPNKVTTIGDYVFSGCSGLTSVHISDLSAWCNIEFGGEYANPLRYAKNLYLNGELLTNLIIPNGVTKIKNYAFYYCSGLTNITIPNSVTSIGERAFSNCSGLTSMAIGNGLTSIGDYAFYGCTGLEEIYVKAKTPPTVGIVPFYDVPTASATLYVPIGAKSAYQAADGWKDFVNIVKSDFNSFKVDGIYYNITDATNKIVEVTYRGTYYNEYSNEYTGNVVIPSSVTYYGEVYSVTSIGEGAFYNCSGLTSVTIPNSVTSIGEDAFHNCSGLESVTIPNSVTSIGEDAFSYCSGLTSVTIPNSVTSIGDYAFYYCSGLTSVTIPNSVTSIGDGAFRYCDGLTSVTIPNSVTSIGSEVFFFCDGLKSVTIPNSVTSIGGYAFYGCDGLTSIEIPNSVTSIGDYAFRGCDGLTSVTIPNSVTSIGERAFEYCYGLKEIYVKAKTPPTVESDAFHNVPTASATLYVPIGTKAAYQVADGWKDFGNIIENDFNSFKADGIFYNITDETNRTVEVTYRGKSYDEYSNEYTGNVVIPSSVTYYGEVYNVTSIGYRAFRDCRGLTSVTIPNSITSIGEQAFGGCTGLTYITIPDGVTSIGDWAFSGCLGLTSMVIGNGVTNIGDYAFYGCTRLEEIYVKAKTPPTTEINTFYNVPTTSATLYVPIGAKSAYQAADGWKDFANIVESDFNSFKADGIFYNITDAVNKTVEVTYRGTSYDEYSNEYTGNIIIPSSVTYYGEVYNVVSIKNFAFYNCSGLTNITIPNSVTSIGEEAFSYCTRLTSVTIPNSVTSIGEGAFSDCSGLKEIYVKAKTPPTINSSVFYNVPAASAILYVPIGAKSAYQAADGWKNFANIIENDFNSFKADGIFYNITDETNRTVEVTYRGKSYDEYSNEYTGNVVIPSSVTYYGEVYNVTSIGYRAFRDCRGLTSVTIPNSVTSIEGSAFNGCSGLTNITIPNSVTSIGDYAFYNCSVLTSMAIGNGLTSIGEWAFSGCTGLEEIYVKAKTPPTTEINTFYDVPTASAILYVPIGAKSAYQAADGWKDFANIIENDFNSFKADGIYYNITDATNKIVEVTYRGTSYNEYSNEYTGNVVIPSSVTYYGEVYNVTSIGYRAFYNCDGLTSIEIPNSVTSIGEGAFCYCNGLTSVTIPNSVTTIGNYAFYGCSGLTSIEIPNSVTSIGSWAFSWCSGLTSIIVENGNSVYDSRENCNAIIETKTNTLVVGCKNTIIPNNITSIGNFAFDGCYGLTSIEIPNSVTSIGEGAFSYCAGLTSIEIPNSVTSIGEEAFYYCYGLTSVTIPNSVTSIGECAFEECTGLKNITIPNSVTSIGELAFSRCTGLEEIYVKAKTPPIINSYVFYSVPTASATLYVPIGAKSAYQAADGWKDFGNIVEKNFGIRGDVNNDGAVSVTDIQSIVNLILRAATISDNPMADVNGDGTISVTDIQSVVNIILNISNTAPARAASRVLSAASSTLYIEPFSINAGEEKEIAVLLDNTGDAFTSLQFDLYLPQGIEVVRDNKGYFLELGSRSSYHGHSAPLCAVQDDDSYRMLCYSGSSELFRDESGDVIKITVRAAEGLADGVYELAVRNVELSRPDETCYNPSATTAAITVGGTTGIEDVNGEMIKEKEEIFDLNGRRVENPSKGIYIINGKKVLLR